MNFTPFDEDDALTAANINSRFSTLSTWANALPAESVARWALTSDHLPAQTFGPGQPLVCFANGFQAASPSLQGGAGDVEEYDNSLPYAAGPAHPVDYQVISSTGGSIYGPVSGDDGNGWRVPSHSSTGTDPMEIDLGGPRTLSTYGITGILVRAQIEVYNARAGALSYLNDDPDDGLPSPDLNEYLSRCVLMAIGIEDNSGNNYVIPRTVRWNSLRGVNRGVISTSTLITDTDIGALSGGNLRRIYGLIASQDWAESSLSATPSPWMVDVRHYNISALPFRAGSLV